MRRFAWLLILAVSLSLATVLVGLRIAALRTISHDDGISYMAATGHEGAYFQTTLAARWVEAAAWQAYWQPDGFFGLARLPMT